MYIHGIFVATGDTHIIFSSLCFQDAFLPSGPLAAWGPARPSLGPRVSAGGRCSTTAAAAAAGCGWEGVPPPTAPDTGPGPAAAPCTASGCGCCCPSVAPPAELLAPPVVLGHGHGGWRCSAGQTRCVGSAREPVCCRDTRATPTRARRYAYRQVIIWWRARGQPPALATHAPGSRATLQLSRAHVCSCTHVM